MLTPSSSIATSVVIPSTMQHSTMTTLSNGSAAAPVSDTTSLGDDVVGNGSGVHAVHAHHPVHEHDAPGSYRDGSHDAEGEEDEFPHENGVPGGTPSTAENSSPSDAGRTNKRKSSPLDETELVQQLVGLSA